ANIDTEGTRGIANVDVPVVTAAVDLDVAHHRLGGSRGIVAADVEQTEDRLGGVPFLTEGRLGALYGVPGQLPITVQPVRIADHRNDTILAITGGQIAGRLFSKVAGGHAHVELAALHFLFRGGVAGSGGLRTRSDRFFAPGMTGGSEGFHQVLL